MSNPEAIILARATTNMVAQSAETTSSSELRATLELARNELKILWSYLKSLVSIIDNLNTTSSSDIPIT